MGLSVGKSWNIIFFETGRGEKPVEEFIYSLNEVTVGKIIHQIDLLEKYGNRLGMPHSKMLGNKLFELRIRGKQEIRIIYAFKQRSIYFLHAFKKKSRKTPAKEIKTALKRLDMLSTSR